MSTSARTALSGAAVALCVLMPGIVLTGAPVQKPATHTVTIDATSFTPATLTVRSGDTVIWLNKDIIPHTATSEPGKFDSGTLPSGESWRFTTGAKGEYPYICSFHPTMKGTLRVR
jgi:plastocyanin